MPAFKRGPNLRKVQEQARKLAAAEAELEIAKGAVLYTAMRWGRAALKGQTFGDETARLAALLIDTQNLDRARDVVTTLHPGYSATRKRRA